MERDRIQVTQHVSLGALWFIGWLFSIGYLKLSFWMGVLAIIVWHMYGVHIKHRNKAMYNGSLSEEEMLHEHPLELADIKAGVDQNPVNPVTLQKRRSTYFPIAAVLAVVLLVGVYAFVNGEQTALTTVPPQENQPEVFVPQTPTLLPPPLPTSTPGPESGLRAAGSDVSGGSTRATRHPSSAGSRSAPSNPGRPSEPGEVCAMT